MHAPLALRLWLGVLLLLCCHRQSRSSEPESTAAPLPPAEVGRGTGGAVASTLRVAVTGSRLRILREEHTGEVTLGTLTLPAPAHDAPLLIGRAAYLTLEGQGVAVIDIGVPEDPYIVWYLAQERIITTLSLSQDQLRLEALQQSLLYDVSEPLRPRGREISRGAARRCYAEAPAGYDADGLSRLAASAPTGRRLRLRSGEILQGRLQRQGDGRLWLCPGSAGESAVVGTGATAEPATIAAPCQGRSILASDIARLDAVYLDEPIPQDVAPPPRPHPGLTSALLRLSEGVQPDDSRLWSALVDGSVGPLLYRVRGTRFEVLRQAGSDWVLLGSTTLPRAGRSSALLIGSAAYVLLEQGVAVIDTALARYPYVAWVLEPTIEVERMQLQAGTLILQKPHWVSRYNLALPLLPSGPSRQAVDFRRFTDQSVTAADASWVERTGVTGPAARRLFLRGAAAQLVWDFRCSTDAARCSFRQAGQASSAAIAEIEHVEAVYAAPSAASTAVGESAAFDSGTAAPARYSWTHLTGPPGTRRVRSPARIAGIILASVGGGVALYGAGSLLVLYMPIGTVGSIGDDKSRTGAGVTALIGLSVGVLGGAIAIVAGDSVEPASANK